MADLTSPIFTNEEAARKHFEGLRWPDGRYCPHCGETERTSPVKGKTAGLYYCNSCKMKFTATVGTVYERSHIPLHKWLAATHLMAASKKGMSAHQIHRMLGITYKSAWFMCHRIREAMVDTSPEPMGGSGKVVEIDETYIGRDPRKKKARGPNHKQPVLSLVERGGRVRSFHIDGTTSKELLSYVGQHVEQSSHVMTDEYTAYRVLREHFAQHSTVNHGKEEYARGMVSTNTIEGFFSIFKRGMKGVYQHCSEKHLHRYLSEFDFRYSNRKVSDAERAALAITGTARKRLTYVQPPKA
jgi:transposase-like protein